MALGGGRNPVLGWRSALCWFSLTQLASCGSGWPRSSTEPCSASLEIREQSRAPSKSKKKPSFLRFGSWEGRFGKVPSAVVAAQLPRWAARTRGGGGASSGLAEW